MRTLCYGTSQASVLVGLKIFVREQRAERTKPLLGDGLEWAKFLEQLNSGRSSYGIDERPHFVL